MPSNDFDLPALVGSLIARDISNWLVTDPVTLNNVMNLRCSELVNAAFYAWYPPKSLD